MRYIPSLKTLQARLGIALEHEHGQAEALMRLKALRKALENWRDRDGTRRFEVLNLANELLGGHGVELIRTEKDDRPYLYGAEYVRTTMKHLILAWALTTSFGCLIMTWTLWGCT